MAVRAARRWLATGLASTVLSTSLAWAAPPAAAPADKTAGTAPESYVLYKLAGDNSLFTFDYGPPASPGLTLLGLSPDTTTPATTLTKFALSLPAAFGKNDNQAAAIDFAPSAIWEPKSDTTFDRYVKTGGYGYRLAHRLRFEIAVKNGTDGGTDPSKAVPSGIAFGANVSLLDSSDPLVTRRSADGTTYISRCVERFTPAVMAILSSSAGFSTDQAEAAQAVRLFSRASIELAKPAPNVALAKSYIAKYLPEQTAAKPAPQKHQQQPVAAVPAAKNLVTLDPSVAGKLGADAAAKLQSDLNAAIRAAMGSASTTAADAGGAPPAAAADAAPVAAPDQPADEGMDLATLKQFVVSQLQTWQDKQTTLDAAGDKAVQNSLTSAVKAQFGVDGITSAFAACATQASRIARFSTDLKLGLGTVWTGKAGELRDLGHESAVGWFSFKLPLLVNLPDATVAADKDQTVPKSAVMFALSGRAGRSEVVSTGDKTIPKITADTLNAWAGFEWVKEDWRLAAQYGWVRTWARDSARSNFNKSGERYLVSSQLRLSSKSGVWLGASYGNAYGTAASLKSSTALITLSYSPPAPPDIAAGK